MNNYGKIAIGIGFLVLVGAVMALGMMLLGAKSEIDSKNAEISEFVDQLEAEEKDAGQFYHAARTLAAALGSLTPRGTTIAVNFGTRGPITITKYGDDKLSIRFSAPYPSYISDSYDHEISGSVSFDLSDLNKVDMGQLSGIAEKSVLRQAIGQFALAYLAGENERIWNDPDYVRLWDAMLDKETTIGFEYDVATGQGTLKIPLGEEVYHYLFSTQNRDYVLKIFDAEGKVGVEFSSKEEFSSGAQTH